MKFVIGQAAKVRKQGFYLELNWMSGDADAYEDTEIGPITEEDFDSLSLLLDWIDRYIDFDHNSKCRNGYKVLDDWREFVDCWPCGEKTNKFAIEWENDVTYEGHPASLESYRIFYIDKYGKEFTAKVVK